jgi:rhamnose transport system permease protein
VSIFGGRGTVLGVVLSAVIVAALQMAMTQLTIDPNVQEIVIGALLLISVVVPSLGRLARWSAERARRSRP